VKFLSSHQSQATQHLQICHVPAVKLNDFATFTIFGVPARVGVLAKSGLVWTGGGPSGCVKEVPNTISSKAADLIEDTHMHTHAHPHTPLRS